jgi:hypothetical protein
MVEVGKAQEAVEIGHFIRSWPIADDLDLGWIHIHHMLIHYVSQILDSLHVEGTLLQIGI